MASDDVAIRVKPPGRTWTRYEAEPETVTLTANTYGPDQASFNLRRDMRVPWADLAAFTPVEIDIAGVTVWAGRLKDTPGRDWDATLNAEGWQYALDDLPIRRLYVHNRLGDWKDSRAFLGASLANFRSNGTVEVGNGMVRLRYQAGELVRADQYLGITLDLGPSMEARSVSLDVIAADTAAAITLSLYARFSPSDYSDAAGFVDAFAGNALTNGVSTTYRGDVATGKRYLHLFAYNGSGAQTLGAAEEIVITFSGIRVFAVPTYRSGDASSVTPDIVIKDAVIQGAPALSTDLTQVTADTFVIPSLGLPQFQTPREMIDGVNALRNNIVRVGIDRRITWKARPTTPLFHVGAWSNYTFEDASLNNGTEIYDKVAVTGTAADGTQGVYENTQTVPLLALTGTTRKKIVTVEAPLDSTVGNRIGQTFLDTHKTSSLNGTVTIAGSQAMRDNGGSNIHPSLLLRNAQELIRLDDRIDPDTGGIGRNGMISTVEYRHSERSATVSLDNTRRSWDAILARYNLLAGAATGA